MWLKEKTATIFSVISFQIVSGRLWLILEFKIDHLFHVVLTMLTYCLQIFLLKYKYLASLQLCEDQGITGNLEKHVCNNVPAILTTNVEIRLKRTVLSCS